MDEARDERKFDFFILDNEIITVHAAAIGIHALGVYVVLVEIAGRSTSCFPSTSTIAALLGVTRQTVSSAIRTLKEHGLIAVEERRRSDNGQTSNEYTIKQVEKARAAPPVNHIDTPVNVVDTPPQPCLHPPVNHIDTNNTYLNKTQLTRSADAREPPLASGASAGNGGGVGGLFHELLDLGMYPYQAKQAIEEGTIQSAADVTRCREFLLEKAKDSTARKPAAMLWDHFLKTGVLPPGTRQSQPPPAEEMTWDEINRRTAINRAANPEFEAMLAEMKHGRV